MKRTSACGIKQKLGIDIPVMNIVKSFQIDNQKKNSYLSKGSIYEKSMANGIQESF